MIGPRGGIERSTGLFRRIGSTSRDEHYGALCGLLPQCKEFRSAGSLPTGNQRLSGVAALSQRRVVDLLEVLGWILQPYSAGSAEQTSGTPCSCQNAGRLAALTISSKRA